MGKDIANDPYILVDPNQNKKEYKNLVEEWEKWIVQENPDGNAKKTIGGKTLTFLRTDMIGPPLQLTAGVIDGFPANTLTRDVQIDAGTGVFFPVYHVHICTIDPYLRGGGTCDTIERCKRAAEIDLDNVYKMWATIKVNNNDSGNIVDDLKKYDIESGQFDLNVVGETNLNREKGYHLGPGTYNGVSHGTYLHLDNFQPGTYVIDFGGMATNYETRSIYTINVNGSESL